MKILLLPLLSVFLLSCTSHPAVEVNNICTLLEDEVGWYKAAKKSEKKWGVPKSLQFAFIHQESRFASDARPPRKTIFGIPWSRSSSAYGFGQVKDTTWEWYELKTNSNGARNNFADVTDFIGWYVSFHNSRLGIAKNDTYNQYLAYHEGHGGFKRKSYNKKPWLINVAKSVRNNASKYKKQLKQCSTTLDSSYGWSLF